MSADSVSVFAEGTFQDQIRELVGYLSRGRSDEEQAAFTAPFEDALATSDGAKPLEEDEPRRKEVVTKVLDQVQGLGEGSEKEIEGFFNLLYAHLLSLFPVGAPETKDRLATILKTILSSPANAAIKYRVLSNLFNALPRRSDLRLPVYQTLLEIASANNDLDALQLSRADVDKWLSEWDISSEEKSEFLKSLSEAFSKAGEAEISYAYTLSYVRSLPSSSSSSQPAAVQAMATALQLPSIFDFDPLFKLDAVVGAKDHPLFALLQVFLNGGLDDYRKWESSNGDAIAQFIQDKAQLERKIRLLNLAFIAFENVGSDLPYSKIASSLQVDTSEVERWVIDVIRAGLVSGKLSQTTQTLHVTRAASRTFARTQWVALEKRLVAWKTGLAAIQDVIASTQKSGGKPPAVTNASGGVEKPSAQTAAVGA